jgi:hypothetical protein
MTMLRDKNPHASDNETTQQGDSFRGHDFPVACPDMSKEVVAQATTEALTALTHSSLTR